MISFFLQSFPFRLKSDQRHYSKKKSIYMIKTKGCKLSHKSDHPSENALNFYETNNYFSTNSLRKCKEISWENLGIQVNCYKNFIFWQVFSFIIFPTCIMLKAGSILELCSIELTLSHSILKKQFS